MTSPVELTDQNDELTRYLFSSSEYRRSPDRPKERAFMPPPDGNFSVFITNDLPEGEIWDIGITVLRGRSPRRLHGRADIRLGAILAQELRGIRDDRPERHVTVVGWPPAAEKERVKSIAQQLANAASAVLLDEPLAAPDVSAGRPRD